MNTIAVCFAISQFSLKELRSTSTVSIASVASSSLKSATIHTSLLSRRRHDSCTLSVCSYFFMTARSSVTASLVTNFSFTSGQSV